MKHKKNKNTFQIVMIAVLGLILAALIGVAVYLNVTEAQLPPDETTNPATTEQTEPTEPTSQPDETTVPVEDIVISTAFCDLFFPGQWKDQLNTTFVESDEGGAMCFYGNIGGREAEVFTILFSRSISSVASPIGVIEVDGEPVLVSVKMGFSDQESTWTEAEHDQIAAMRESINHLIGKLSTVPGFTTNMDALHPDQSYEDLQVTTPYVILRYPGAWQDQVWAEYAETADGGEVTFCGAVGGEDVTIFVVRFGPAGKDAARVGYVKVNDEYLEVSIRVNEPETTAGWSDKDRNTFAAMQEGINDMLADLKNNPAYFTEPVVVTPPETTQPVKEPDVVVSTSYVELSIPAIWKDQMHTKIEDQTGGYTVTFIGTVGSHQAPLFAVLVGVTSDSCFPVGVLKVDGKEVSVSIELMELNTDDSWSTEEINTISAMQESLNDVLGELSKKPNFTAY